MEYYNFLGLSSSSSSSSASASASSSSCSSILSSPCLYSSSVSMNGVKVEKDLIGVLEERGKYAGLDVSLSLRPPAPAKKCAWCGVISTPLWRTGPDGPKSLCNACGIRYRKEETRLNTSLTLGPPNLNVQANAPRTRLFYN